MFLQTMLKKIYKFKYEFLLFFVFFLALAFRLYFVFQTPYFSDDSSYLVLRQVDHVKSFNTPMFYDDLSYGGKPSIHLPVYPYIAALFSLVPYGLKVIPSILISSLVFIVYLIALRFSASKFDALIASLMSAFIPIVISSTLNTLSVLSLVLPLIFLMFYSFLNLKSRFHLYLFIFLSFFIPLLHPLAVFIAISLIFFYILVLAEDIEVYSLTKEAMVFSVFLALLIEFLFFKSAFLSLGLSFVWQNIPKDLLDSYFKDLNLIDSIVMLGVLPFIFGVIGFTFGFFRDKTWVVFLFMSSAFSALVLLSFKLVNFSSGLMLLGIALVIGSSLSISKFFKYLELTKFSRSALFFKCSLVVLVLVILIPYSFFSAQGVISNALSDDEALILHSIDDSTEFDSTVLSLFSEGNYITYLGNRKDVMDSDFLTAPSVNARYEDVKEIYTSVSEVKALQLLEKYNVGYIYFTPRARKFYNVENLSYVENEKCFVEYRKSGEVYLYKVRC